MTERRGGAELRAGCVGGHTDGRAGGPAGECAGRSLERAGRPR